MNATLLLQRTGRLLALATGVVALATAGILAFASRADAHAVALVRDGVGDVKYGPETPRLPTPFDAGREIVLGPDSTGVVFYVRR